ncbi:MAG: tetratricopeptide repeat protein [Hydrogenothermaceae bacterium]|nr:tetratricopeptide repeat protein [Hydrogenothermaceae bacterium]
MGSFLAFLVLTGFVLSSSGMTLDIKSDNPLFYYGVCKVARDRSDTNTAYIYCKRALELSPYTASFHRETIMLSLSLNKREEAEKLLKQYLEVFRDTPDSYLFASVFYTITKENDKVISILSDGLRKFPEDERIMTSLSDAYIEVKDFDRAVSILSRLAELKKEDPSVYYRIARIYLFKNQIKKAVENLKKSLQVSKSYRQSWSLLGEIYRQTKSFDEAIDVYTTILKEDQNNLEALNRLFQVYVDKDDFPNAAKTIDRIILLNPKDKDVLLKKFMLYLKAGKIKEIISQIENTVKDDPDNYSLKYILGMAYESDKELKKAKGIYEELYNTNQDPELADRLGQVYVSLKEYDKALDLYNKLYISNPKDYRILLIMADIEDKRGNIKQALELTSEAERIKGDDPTVHFVKAVYLDKLGRWKDAEKSLYRALDLRSDYGDALNYLGYTYIDRDIDIDRGMELVKKALEVVPNSAAYLDSLGWGYYKKGNYQEALKYIEKALEKMPDDPVLNEHYGDVLLKLGKKEDAVKYYKNALKLIKEKGEGEPGQKERVLKKLR